MSFANINLGVNAGNLGQGGNAIAIGYNAGMTGQGGNAIALGNSAGMTGQFGNAIALGNYAGSVGQNGNSIAIGNYVGLTGQKQYAVAIGDYAGQINQGLSSVAIGYNAGQISQGAGAVAIGNVAGRGNQGIFTVALGYNAGLTNQSASAVAIGLNAGQNGQGSNAIAIGNSAGNVGQPANSIVINATGSGINGATASACYVAPIRSDASYNSVLSYNSTTNEITTGGYVSNVIKSSSSDTFHCGGNSYYADAITSDRIFNGICSGTGDGFSYTTFNLGIASWNSTGFYSTNTNSCNLVINNATGDLNTKGVVNTAGVASSGALVITEATGNQMLIQNGSNRWLFNVYPGDNRIHFRGWNGTNDWVSQTVSFDNVGNIFYNGLSSYSDDRIKTNETFITDATTTIQKLRPQKYHKYGDFDCSGNYAVESGLIAQEIYYDAPELRHLVKVPDDATFDTSGNITSSIDPTADPTGYSQWGSTPAAVNYSGLIPYLIKSIQEQQEIIANLQSRIAVLENV